MTKLVATEVMLRQHRRAVRQLMIDRFLLEARSGKRRTPQAGSGRPKQGVPATPVPDRLAEPTPERAVKAESSAVVVSKAPPFNAQILGVAQRYAKQLGPELMLLLEQFYEAWARGAGDRHMTGSYDGYRVDISRSDYQHLAAGDADMHERFRLMLRSMPPELQSYAKELVLGDIGAEINSARGAPPRRARTVAEIGGEISSYHSDQRYSTGAVVAILKVIAWCVQHHTASGGSHGKAKRKVVRLP